uniref:Uncharacterized protein n=1 Tax=Aegilops tauschii subsp. strangulata TaxID=200361 RepID=A0A453MY00_AEGTS
YTAPESDSFSFIVHMRTQNRCIATSSNRACFFSLISRHCSVFTKGYTCVYIPLVAHERPSVYTCINRAVHRGSRFIYKPGCSPRPLVCIRLIPDKPVLCKPCTISKEFYSAYI